MQTKTIIAPAISCGHCVRSIETELTDVNGVRSVKADLATKQVVINWDAPADWEAIKAMLIEIGYAPQELIQL